MIPEIKINSIDLETEQRTLPVIIYIFGRVPVELRNRKELSDSNLALIPCNRNGISYRVDSNLLEVNNVREQYLE